MIEPITAIPYRDYNESSTVRPECFGHWTAIEDVAGIVASACEVYHDFPKYVLYKIFYTIAEVKIWSSPTIT